MAVVTDTFLSSPTLIEQALADACIYFDVKVKVQSDSTLSHTTFLKEEHLIFTIEDAFPPDPPLPFKLRARGFLLRLAKGLQQIAETHRRRVTVVYRDAAKNNLPRLHIDPAPLTVEQLVEEYETSPNPPRVRVRFVETIESILSK